VLGPDVWSNWMHAWSADPSASAVAVTVVDVPTSDVPLDGAALRLYTLDCREAEQPPGIPDADCVHVSVIVSCAITLLAKSNTWMSTVSVPVAVLVQVIVTVPSRAVIPKNGQFCDGLPERAANCTQAPLYGRPDDVVSVAVTVC
jgi:hypothetical protein